jgi:two-component system response regulator PilR (NtrC family)
MRAAERRHRGSTGNGTMSADQPKILVIDDEDVMQDVLGRLLRRKGFAVECAGSAEEGLARLAATDFDAVLCDIMLPGMNGLEALQSIRRDDPHAVVIMITAYASVESAIEAMKSGAFDYIAKPFKNEEVLLTITKGVEHRRLTLENRTLKRALSDRFGFSNIIGRSAEMKEIFELITQAAPSRSTILIQGESGTGKELIAKAIHANSPRAGQPFIVVNSGSMPADLLESNLFGHVKGAFTGAINNKKGLFELADRGTIFFDEVGNLSQDTQAKILRVIQEREFMRLGGVESIRVDTRIIAATNANLAEAVQNKDFREDLFYRLNVITISLPPLRRRASDVPLLAMHFLRVYNEENGKAVAGFSAKALSVLEAYHWPGNVRELENTVERAVVLCTSTEIDLDLIPAHIRNPDIPSADNITIPEGGLSLKKTVEEFEKALILRALALSNGVQKSAAQLLQVKPTTLSEMIKRLKLKPRSS